MLQTISAVLQSPADDLWFRGTTQRFGVGATTYGDVKVGLRIPDTVFDNADADLPLSMSRSLSASSVLRLDTFIRSSLRDFSRDQEDTPFRASPCY